MCKTRGKAKPDPIRPTLQDNCCQNVTLSPGPLRGQNRSSGAILGTEARRATLAGHEHRGPTPGTAGSIDDAGHWTVFRSRGTGDIAVCPTGRAAPVAPRKREDGKSRARPYPRRLLCLTISILCVRIFLRSVLRFSPSRSAALIWLPPQALSAMAISGASTLSITR